MRSPGTDGERVNALTAATIKRQRDKHAGRALEARVHRRGGGWGLQAASGRADDGHGLRHRAGERPLDLVLNLMIWERVRHVPVEDAQHKLVGLVSAEAVLRAAAQWLLRRNRGPSRSPR